MSGQNENRHPFLDDLSPGAQLTSSILRRPVSGPQNIRRIVTTVGTLYRSQTVTSIDTVGSRSFLQYQALLINGKKLDAVVAIERNDAGAVARVSVTFSPLDAVLSAAAQLGRLLEHDLGPELFL
jgi:hypothetical protein